MVDPMIEQRRYARIAVDVAVTYSAPAAAPAATPARSKDISLGGMFIKTDRPPPPGSEVAIAVTLPDQKDLLLIPAVVRWVQGSEGMGVQFTQIDNKITFAITHYVATRPTPKPGKLKPPR